MGGRPVSQFPAEIATSRGLLTPIQNGRSYSFTPANTTEPQKNNVDLDHQFSGSPASSSHNITTRNVQLSLALKASSYNC